MLDAFAPLRYLALVVRMGVRRFGWKAVAAGWVLSGIAAVILNYTT